MGDTTNGTACDTCNMVNGWDTTDDIASEPIRRREFIRDISTINKDSKEAGRANKITWVLEATTQLEAQRRLLYVLKNDYVIHYDHVWSFIEDNWPSATVTDVYATES